MTTPVKFELAKLLKKKGFEQNPMKHINQATMEGTLVFPTIVEVIMWLYEKHGIWIEVNTDVNGKFYWLLKELKASQNNYNSPTEAYEAGIYYVLSKI
jgi:hypothetical protein